MADLADLKRSLTHKIGPLPVWVYGVALGGGVLYIRQRNAAAAAEADTGTAYTGVTNFGQIDPNTGVPYALEGAGGTGAIAPPIDSGGSGQPFNIGDLLTLIGQLIPPNTPPVEPPPGPAPPPGGGHHHKPPPPVPVPPHPRPKPPGPKPPIHGGGGHPKPPHGGGNPPPHHDHGPPTPPKARVHTPGGTGSDTHGPRRGPRPTTGPTRHTPPAGTDRQKARQGLHGPSGSPPPGPMPHPGPTPPQHGEPAFAGPPTVYPKPPTVPIGGYHYPPPHVSPPRRKPPRPRK